MLIPIPKDNEIMEKTKLPKGKFEKSNDICLRVKKGDKTVKVIDKTNNIKKHLNKAIKLLEV